MNKTNTHLWLLRLYALVVLVVLFGGFLEGAAFNLVIGLSALGVIVSSFLMTKAVSNGDQHDRENS